MITRPHPCRENKFSSAICGRLFYTPDIFAVLRALVSYWQATHESSLTGIERNYKLSVHEGLMLNGVNLTAFNGSTK